MEKTNKPQTVNITNPWEHVLKLLFLCYIFCKSFLLSLLLTTNSRFQILVCFFKWLAPFELDLSVFYQCSPISILFPDDIHSFKNFHRKGLLSDTIPQYFSEQACPSKCDSWGKRALHVGELQLSRLLTSGSRSRRSLGGTQGHCDSRLQSDPMMGTQHFREGSVLCLLP